MRNSMMLGFSPEASGSRQEEVSCQARDRSEFTVDFDLTETTGRGLKILARFTEESLENNEAINIQRRAQQKPKGNRHTTKPGSKKTESHSTIYVAQAPCQDHFGVGFAKDFFSMFSGRSTRLRYLAAALLNAETAMNLQETAQDILDPNHGHRLLFKSVKNT